MNEEAWWKVIGDPGGDIRVLDTVVRDRLDRVAAGGVEDVKTACRALRGIVWRLEVDVRFVSVVSPIIVGFTEAWSPALGVVAWGNAVFSDICEDPMRWWKLNFPAGITLEGLQQVEGDIELAEALFEWVAGGFLEDRMGISSFDLEVDYSLVEELSTPVTEEEWSEIQRIEREMEELSE